MTLVKFQRFAMGYLFPQFEGEFELCWHLADPIRYSSLQRQFVKAAVDLNAIEKRRVVGESA